MLETNLQGSSVVERETQFVRQHEISLSDPPNYLHAPKTLASQLLSILILPAGAAQTVHQ